MHSVLLDGWVCDQIFRIGRENLTDEAYKMIDVAMAEGKLHISVVSYMLLRESLQPDRRHELDKAMVQVTVEPLSKEIVVSLSKIPDVAGRTARLIAATALCKNLVLITATPALGCDGLSVIGARAPEIIAVQRTFQNRNKTKRKV
jgi:predicted nucleic acid-binding protein